jgi:hypothetical protein
MSARGDQVLAEMMPAIPPCQRLSNAVVNLWMTRCRGDQADEPASAPTGSRSAGEESVPRTAVAAATNGETK